MCLGLNQIGSLVLVFQGGISSRVRIRVARLVRVVYMMFARMEFGFESYLFADNDFLRAVL